MPRLSKIGAAALAAFGWTSGAASVTASYLQVAGGGGGGGTIGGGGGAGGYLTGTTSLNPTLSYTVTVGAGGAGGVNDAGGGTAGVNGSNSSITGLTASVGGGGGGTYASGVAGNNGGSGGGGGAKDSGIVNAGGTATAGQGNNGGSGRAGVTPWNGGGGGGAGAAGGNATTTSGSGGNGLASSISGTSVTYAGGGGGAAHSTGGVAGSGGTGGGGAGAITDGSTGGSGSVNAGSGTTNLGAGGGGGGYVSSSTAGNGGSGVVIISYPAPQQFGGGVVTASGANIIHTFNTSGTLSPINSLTASYLVVAGGGGAAYAGGGAGGLLSGSGLTLDTNSIYAVTVGAGGSGAPGQATYGFTAVATNGSNSSFSMVSTAAVGGGAGGPNISGVINGSSGGSGGGGTVTGTGGAGTAGQGNAGGSAVNNNGYATGGGGGGASAVGGNASTSGSAPNATLTGGNGGAGTASSISGSSVTYAGGGGGSVDGRVTGTKTVGTGGAGGGGTAVFGNGATPNPGVANTGGGGGGNYFDNSAVTGSGGAGGSGIVIISYPGSTQLMAGGTVTVAGGNVIHTFTSSGFLSPIVLLTNSLRFRSSASAYLNRTPASASNRRTWTWSGWVKRGALGSNQALFSCESAASNYSVLYFSSGNILQFYTNSGGTDYSEETVAVFRDPSSWYHVVFALDTTQATASNRAKIYINGVQQTTGQAFGQIPQNNEPFINSLNQHAIGRDEDGNVNYFDGYLTDINFIDGQALTPSSFGTTNDLGIWQPVRYGGSYGTNGFYLPFTDNSALTTSSNVGLGKDFSGNGNYFATNNISITAGSTYDSMTDVPTLTSATTANFATLNPLAFQSSAPTGGNLNGDGTNNCTATIACPSSGKYYFEMTMTNGGASGQIGIFATTCPITSLTAGTMLYTTEGRLYENDVLITSSWATFTNGDTVAVAVNMDAGEISFYKNNTLQGTRSFVNQITSSSPVFAVRLNSGVTASANFGQRPFAYTPPTGFVALNTFNLPTPTIGATASTQANRYFDVVLRNGFGSSGGSITSLQFQPDFWWEKARSGAASNNLEDSVRGVTKILISNSTAAETTDTTYLTSFNSNGFTMGTGDYGTGTTLVDWCWKAGGAGGVSNTAGSITSTVSANTSAGFSIVTYTGTGSNATVGHGLGVAPSMIIVKRRTTAGGDWQTYHASLGATKFIKLNTTDAAGTATSPWNDTAPTSTVFSLGTNGDTNLSASNLVAYCFSEVAGYSKFGSYTGNASTTAGPFVFCGFRPRYVMVKCTSAAGQNWVVWDTSRSPFNLSTAVLYPNGADAEGTATVDNIDIVSNGFRSLGSSGGSSNNNGATYIFMAFAENPFKYSNAR